MRTKPHVTVERLDADHRSRIAFVLLEPSAATQKDFRARMWCLTKLRDLGYFAKPASLHKPPRRKKT